ncbi:MAG: sensor histidine kinase, partial [Planctomycetes bacterium]|nr:sensor histidine kinase [Planctomycetota bacterium]
AEAQRVLPQDARIVHERAKIGRDLHDGLGQQLTGLGFLAECLRHELSESAPPQALKAKRLVEGIQDAIGQMQDIAFGLAPVGAGPDGLARALRRLAEEIDSIGQTQCRFVCDRSVVLDCVPTASELFRIAQEAVDNAMKHSGATEIEIRLRADQILLELEVRDNGSGIDPDASSKVGMGLRSMRERADAIGATLEIGDACGGGTLVHCLYALRKHDAGEDRNP